jgi:hypothetical protein
MTPIDSKDTAPPIPPKIEPPSLPN